MDLSLHRLRILREVERHDGVTAAAHAMGYSPSGVSQQLSALEHEVGAPILERVGRRVRLTAVGRVLLEHADILLDAAHDAQAAVEQARDTHAVELTVGVFASVAAGLIPTILGDLATHYPQVTIKTREVDPEDALTDLRHGHLDLAFLIDYPQAAEPWPTSLTVVLAGRDQMHLVAPAGQFDAGAVRLGDLADHDWIISGPHTYYGRAVRAACRRAGFELRIAHQVNEQATALAMVAAGLGITLMSDLAQTFRPAGVDVLELRRPIHRRLLIAHQTAARQRPAVPIFVDSATRAGAALSTRTES
ncbi:LysR family transcriptional regulator [soil metagenome]